MVLQQCAFKTISLTVVEKQFESQSYFTYAEEIFTIGMYGRCIHPYFDCFWISHYMNFNNFLNNATNSSVLKGLKKNIQTQLKGQGYSMGTAERGLFIKDKYKN